MNRKRHLDLYRVMEKHLTLKVLSVKYAIILLLFITDSADNREIMGNSHVSAATFQHALADLVDQGLIDVGIPAFDRRRRIYYLPGWVRERLGVFFQGLANLYGDAVSGHAMLAVHGFHDLLRKMERAFDFRCFTGEYEVILFLYNDDDQSAGDLFTLLKISASSFYGILTRLEKMALVAASGDATDRRRRRYTLGADVRRFLDDQHQQMCRPDVAN